MIKRTRIGLVAMAALLGAFWALAQQGGQTTAGAQQGRGQAAGVGARGQDPARGPRGGGRGAGRTRKVLLAWADTRNGVAQHDSTSHALAVIERIGYESGVYDTYIRTDSHIVSFAPKKTTGEPASGGPSLTQADAVFFLGHREVPLDDAGKADLVTFIKDQGKGFVAAHIGLTAFESWPEFANIIGGGFEGHVFGNVSGPVVNEDPSFPATRHFAPVTTMTDEYYLPKNYSRDKIRVLLRLDISQFPPNANYKRTDGDFPVAYALMYGKGRVFFSSLGHDVKAWDNPDVYRMYYEAIKWSMGLTDADITPRPLPAGVKPPQGNPAAPAPPVKK